MIILYINKHYIYFIHIRLYIIYNIKYCLVESEGSEQERAISISTRHAFDSLHEPNLWQLNMKMKNLSTTNATRIICDWRDGIEECANHQANSNILSATITCPMMLSYLYIYYIIYIYMNGWSGQRIHCHYYDTCVDEALRCAVSLAHKTGRAVPGQKCECYII